MAESRVSVGASLSYAWHLWRSSARSIWGVLALSSLAWTVFNAGKFATNDTVTLCGLGAAVLLSLVTLGSMYRIAFAENHPSDPGFVPGHLGLQWGRLEWRLLGASSLMALFLFVVMTLAAVAVSAVCIGVLMNRGAAAAQATPEALAATLGPQGMALIASLGPQGMTMAKAIGPQGMQIFILMASLVYLGTAYVFFRLILTWVATADGGRMQVLATWRLTRGAFWRILISVIGVWLPVFFTEFLVLVLAESGQVDPTPLIQLPADGAVAGGLVLGALTGALAIPLTAGVLAYYYRHLRTPAAGANDKKP